MNDVMREAAIGSFGSAAACVVSNPIDVVRTKVQLRMSIGVDMWWQRGLGAAMAYNVALNSIRFSLFRFFSSDYLGLPLLAAGSLSGLIAGFAASPLAIIRTRLQAGSSLSEAPRSLLSPLRGGAPAWALRNAGHTACIFSLYDTTSKVLEESSSAPAPVRHLAASGFAATVSCVLMNPLDVACSRIFYSGINAGDVARSMLSEGPTGALLGLRASIMRTVPHTALTFVIVESIRGRLSLGSSPPINRERTPILHR